MTDPDAERLRWVERMAGVYDDEPDDGTQTPTVETRRSKNR